MKPEELMVINTRDMLLEPRAFAKGFAFGRYEVVAAGGGSGCCVRLYSVPPGKSNYPYHFHETHEEVFYIISGEGTLTCEVGERPVGAGDVIVCPPGEKGAHKLSNPPQGEAPLVYIEFDTVRYPEVAHYPRVNGLGVLLEERARNAFFIDGQCVPYSDICEGG